MSDTATQTFQVGQRVRVYRDDIGGMAANRVGTIREVDYDGFYWVDGASESDYGFSRPSLGDSPVARGSWFTAAEMYLVDEPAEGTLAAYLTEHPIPGVTVADNSLQAKVDRLIADLQTIGKALAETADRSEWCSEYEAHLNRLVPQLSEDGRYAFEQAATREHEYTVTFTVTARDREDAITRARYDVSPETWTIEPTVREY